jgi:AcrR family transcriptional regulator
VSQATGGRTSSRRAEQVAARRAELLAAAYQVVLERGLANTRVADVAAATNVSGGLIHYHFATKDDLIVEMLRSIAGDDIVKARDIAASKGSAVARMDRLIRHYAPDPGEDPAWRLWIDGWAAGVRDPAMRQIMTELDAAWAQCVEQVIRDGVADGEFTCAEPAVIAQRLSSLYDGLGLRVMVDAETMSRRMMLRHAREATALELGIDVTEFTKRNTA